MMRFAMWTPKQRFLFIVFLSFLTFWLTTRLLRDSETVPADLPSDGPRAAELLDHLDLNTADAASLAAIPRLGEKKANDIVAYREKFIHDHSRPPFGRIEDLYRIKGIGPGTIAQMRSYVSVTTQTTSRP